MHTVLLFLLGGTMLGTLLRKQKWVLQTADKATHWAIYLLLFLLGLSVGVNDTVMQSLGTLGWQAFLLSSGAVLGSALSAMVLYRWFWLESSEDTSHPPANLP